MGHFASREGPSRDTGHRRRNMGCPGKYGVVGYPRKLQKRRPVKHKCSSGRGSIFTKHFNRPGRAISLVFVRLGDQKVTFELNNL